MDAVERAHAEEVKDMRRTSRAILISLVTVSMALLAYRAIFPSEAYTLYRGAEDDPKSRTPVAMFKSGEGAKSNEENCVEVLAAMQQRQPAYKVRYWCERDRI